MLPNGSRTSRGTLPPLLGFQSDPVEEGTAAAPGHYSPCGTNGAGGCGGVGPRVQVTADATADAAAHAAQTTALVNWDAAQAARTTWDAARRW